MQRTPPLALSDFPLCLPGFRDCRVGGDGNEGVEQRVELRYALQAMLGKLHGRDSSLAQLL